MKSHLNQIKQETKKNDEEAAKEDEIVDELEDKNNCLQDQLIEEAKKSEESVEFNMQKSITDKIQQEA